MKPWGDRRATLIVVDTVAAAAAVFAGVRLRFGISWRESWETVLGLPSVWIFALVFAVMTFLSFALAGTYRHAVYWTASTELADVARGLLALGVTTLSLLYLLKLEDVSRVALSVSFSLLAGAVVGVRLLLGRTGRRIGSPGRRWLLVGNAGRAEDMASVLRRNTHLGVEIVGVVGTRASLDGRVPWLGSIEDLPQILAGAVVDEVVVALDGADWAKLEAVLVACAEQGKTVRLPLDAMAPSLLRGRLEEFDGLPMWSVLVTPDHRLSLALKRLIDVVGSATLLVLAAPVLAISALLIRIRDGSPVLFRQRRGGLHGRPFEMLKLRTMVRGAEELKQAMLDRNERTGPVFKVADDPRVTRVGRILRKWSIDELPQLWNVLRGDMSLVGPRPQPLEEVNAYDLWHRRRLSMRPGITGLWQVEARHDASFDTWMALDLRYIDGWSLLLDLRILAMTPVAAVRSPGT